MATLAVSKQKPKTDMSKSGRGQLLEALVRVVRVAPSFLVLAALGTAVVYLMGVPAKERVVAASVPLVLIFLMSRAMVFLVPEPPPQKLPDPPATFKILMLVVFISAFAALDLVLASGVFSLMGLPDLTSKALNLALTNGLISSLTFVLTVFYVVQTVIGADLKALIIAGLWKAVSCPTVLADRMSMPHRSTC